MRIGIDFDNTIANYDGVFYQVACHLNWIPSEIGHKKIDVKNYFIEHQQETKWTELQGLVYTEAIQKAQPYPGFLDVLQHWLGKHDVYIVSHKTRFPVIGKPISLHQAAQHWLNAQHICGASPSTIHSSHVSFHETLDAKIQCITRLNLDFFVDDLKKVFLHPDFPQRTQKYYFCPDTKQGHELYADRVICHWHELLEVEHA